MMLRLQQYDVDIQYRPGKEMILADSLSRVNPAAGTQSNLEQSIYAVQFSPERLQELKQKTDQDEELTRKTQEYNHQRLAGPGKTPTQGHTRVLVKQRRTLCRRWHCSQGGQGTHP